MAADLFTLLAQVKPEAKPGAAAEAEERKKEKQQVETLPSGFISPESAGQIVREIEMLRSQEEQIKQDIANRLKESILKIAEALPETLRESILSEVQNIPDKYFEAFASDPQILMQFKNLVDMIKQLSDVAQGLKSLKDAFGEDVMKEIGKIISTHIEQQQKLLANPAVLYDPLMMRLIHIFSTIYMYVAAMQGLIVSLQQLMNTQEKRPSADGNVELKMLIQHLNSALRQIAIAVENTTSILQQLTAERSRLNPLAQWLEEISNIKSRLNELAEVLKMFGYEVYSPTEQRDMRKRLIMFGDREIAKRYFLYEIERDLLLHRERSEIRRMLLGFLEKFAVPIIDRLSRKVADVADQFLDYLMKSMSGGEVAEEIEKYEGGEVEKSEVGEKKGEEDVITIRPRNKASEIIEDLDAYFFGGESMMEERKVEPSDEIELFGGKRKRSPF